MDYHDGLRESYCRPGIRLTAFIAPTGIITTYEMRQCDSNHVPFQDIS